VREPPLGGPPQQDDDTEEQTRHRRRKSEETPRQANGTGDNLEERRGRDKVFDRGKE
jgi:hypothetical protein